MPLSDPSPSWFPSSADAAVYVYAVVEAPVPDLEREGIEDRPVHGLEHDGFGVVASVVDPSDWTGEAGADHMKDLAWVGPRAYRHEQVVEAVMDAAPAVYPARFGTLFSSPDRVRDTLDDWAETLREFLASVDGAEEWAVKGLLDRAQATERQVEAPADESGTAYLQRQKQRQEADGTLAAWLDDVAETLFDPLAAQAADARVLPVQGDAGREQEVAFNWAFLVPDGCLDTFQDEAARQAERYAEEGLTLDVTGPWPPYNFRPSLDDEA